MVRAGATRLSKYRVSVHFSLFFQTLGPLCSPAAVTAATGASVMLSHACHISKRTLFAFKFKKILPVAYIIAVTARLLSAPLS